MSKLILKMVICVIVVGSLFLSEADSVAGRPYGSGLYNVGIYDGCVPPYAVGDLNEDCRFDFKDLAFFASDWLRCNDPTNVDCEQVW